MTIDSLDRSIDATTITELYNAFSRITKTSPDLQIGDANAIVDSVKKQQLDPVLAVLEEAKKPKEKYGFAARPSVELPSLPQKMRLKEMCLELKDIKLNQ